MPYDPESSLRELRDAVANGHPSMRSMAAICSRAADRAAGDLWPDPRARETAGIGAVVAAATLAAFTEPGRDAPIINAVGLFGLALVDSARAELREASDGT